MPRTSKRYALTDAKCPGRKKDSKKRARRLVRTRERIKPICPFTNNPEYDYPEDFDAL